MNNLKTDINGGFPFTLDDLRFVNAAQMEAFVGVVKALIGNLPYAILQGCEYSVNADGTWHINEGYLYFNNEIFYAPAQDVAAQTSGSYFWDVDLTVDHSGDKAFSVDGVVHSTYEIRRAKLNYYISGAEGTRPPMLTDNTITILKNRLGIEKSPQISNWNSVPLSSSNVTITTSGTLSSVSGELRYMLIEKTIYIDLSMTITISNADSYTKNIGITLPSWMLPKSASMSLSLIADLDISNNLPVPLYTLFGIFGQQFLGINAIDSSPFSSREYSFHGQIFYEIA